MHKRLLALTAGSRPVLTVAILAGLLAGMCSLAQAYALSTTVDLVFLGRADLGAVADWLRILLALIAGRGLMAWLQERAAGELAIRVKSHLRQRLVAHILALGPAFTQGERSSELTTAATEGVEALDAYYSQYVPQLLISLLVPFSILGVVFAIDPLSGAVLLLTGPLIPFFMYMIGRGAEGASARQYEALGRLSFHFLDSLQGLTTLKIFGQSKAQAQNIARVADQFRLATFRVMQVSFLSAFALELLATISTAIIAVEVGLRLLYAQMPFREALFVLILAPEFYVPLRLLGMRFHAGMAGTAAGKRIFTILDTPIQPPLVRPTPSAPGTTAIALDHVTYTYEGRTESAIKDISLSIASGEHVALVGSTGAGKTTLASLMLGFLRPSAGSVVVGGVRTSQADAEALSPQIAWVSQLPYVFHDTVAANIRLGKPHASMDEVRAAAQGAHLDEYIASLPSGYETDVGEGGARLSSGEAQRLAIARAFLKDAPILILDEPSSSLDPETEALLEDSLRDLCRGRTVITIAHRLNTVRNADRIFVLQRGRIVESGTHAALVSSGGAYSRLIRAGTALGTEVPGSHSVDEARRLTPPSLPGLAAVTALGGLGPATLQESASSSIDARLGSFAVVRRLLGFLQGSWGWMLLSIAAASLTIGSSVALMGTSAWLISAAALHPSIATLQVAIVGVRFFGIARAVFRYAERLLSHGVTFRLLRNIRVWFYNALEPLAPGRMEVHRAGDLLARAIADVETLDNLFVRLLGPPAVAAVVATGVFIFLASMGAAVQAIVVMVAFILIGGIMPVLASIGARVWGVGLVRLRAALHVSIVDTVQGLAEILSYGRASDRLETLRALGADYARVQRGQVASAGVNLGLTVLLTNLAAVLVLVTSIPMVRNGVLPGSMLASLALLTLAGFEAVAPLPLSAQLWPSTKAAAARLFGVADQLSASGSRPPEPVLLTPGSRKKAVGLRFHNVSFTYPDQRKPALHGVSFRLAAGDHIGIVGPTGAGKSTIASLLLRFWDWQDGDIFLDGASLREIDPERARAWFSVVPQQAYFFDTSIFENLRLARPGVRREEIENATGVAQIADYIRSLPHGYDTPIGEHGLRLSAGERQRLAIARAIIKAAPVLILDEPTSNLDTGTAARVLAGLRRTMDGRSTILITHRLIGLDQLDQVLVFDRGSIVQRGRHAELLAAGGTYRRLWDAQDQPRLEPSAGACATPVEVL